MKSIFTEEYEEALDFLLQARKNAGLTQQELADTLSRPQSFISKYEHSERRLDIVEFLHIASALGISNKKLFSFLKQIGSPKKGWGNR